jgi:hypothetical protein
MNTRSLVAAGLILAVALVAGMGCSGRPSVGKRLAEKQMEGALNQAGGGHSQVDIGSSGSVDLSGLPAEFRQPGAAGIGHVGGGDANGKTDTYILQTDEAAGAVLAAYKQRLAGWKQVAFMEAPGATSMTLEAPDGTRHASVLVGTERRTGKTNISITLTDK